MRKINIFSAVLFLFLLVPASITWAQTITQEKGLLTVSFTQPVGKTTIYLPGDLRPGELVSGTIQYSPGGKNQKQITSNLNELRHQYFMVNGSRPGLNSETQHFQFMVMLGDGKIELFSSNGKILQSVPFTPLAITDDLLQNTCVIPTHALVGSPKSIKGPFDGNMDNTRCTLNLDPIQILAESKRECIISYPATASGSQRLMVEEAGKPSCSGAVEGVTLSAKAGKKTLMGGEQTYLEIMIRGLQNLPDMATLRVNNLSVTTVSLLPSNTITITLPPDSITNGAFNSSFVIVGIRPGDFAISVDLDLPEQSDHPQTQPQCPACSCSCSADITLDGKAGDISSYSVHITGGCSGSFGYPPCEPCKTSYAYEWTVSSSADKPVVIVGGRNEGSVRISNPKNGSFTLDVKVTVLCSVGRCDCSASTRYLATNPVEPPTAGRCSCEASCSIIETRKDCEGKTYEAIVTAACKGVAVIAGKKIDCRVVSVFYEWKIGEAGKGAAGISGGSNGKSVKVKLTSSGSYTIYLTVKVTCSDGTTCTYTCSKEETVSDCIPDYEWCAGPAIKLKAMGYFPADPSLLSNMRPGDLIGLSVYGIDNDVLLQKCIKGEDIDITPHPPTPDQVTYSWSINNIQGTSGKLITAAGIRSNSILYQIPYCLTDFHVVDRIIVTLGNAGNKKDDEEIQVEFTITLEGKLEKYKTLGYDQVRSLYYISARVEGRILNKPEDIKCPSRKGCCQAVLPALPGEGSKLSFTEPIQFKFAVDSFPDNMVLLKAEASDNDDLTIKCRTTGGKIISRKIEGIYDDAEITWKIIKGNARFVYDTGATVVLIHNYNDKEKALNELVIECRVRNRPAGNEEQYIDKPPESLLKDRKTRKKPIAVVGLGEFENTIGDIPIGTAQSTLRRALDFAACKYRNAGYDVIVDYELGIDELEITFKNPAVQACFLIGNGKDGNIQMHDKYYFADFYIMKWTADKWGCDKDPLVHPFIRELHLLGSETGKGKWYDRFFRLENYSSYPQWFYDNPIDMFSKMISRASSLTPLPPRIAPPGEPKLDILSCCLCGPDVTVALKKTLDGVIKVHNGLSAKERLMYCQSLVNPKGFEMAWDMLEMKFTPSKFCISPCCEPKAPCFPSVQVGNGCYMSNSVNYSLFGVMCKLCGISINTMLELIQGWKGPILSADAILSILKGQLPKGASNFEYSSLWACQGYLYVTTRAFVPLVSEFPCLTKCPMPNPLSEFTVRWGTDMDFLKGLK